MRYPRFLQPGDRIGVTSPSSGVPEQLAHRLRFSVSWLRDRGYDVEVGRCMDGASHVSGTAQERASELTTMLLDPQIRAIIPPWGGETAIDLIPLLDFDRLRDAEPTWVVGYSDISTLLAPLTLVSGWATVHGTNLMDFPYQQVDGLLHPLDVIAGGPGSTGFFRQRPAAVHRVAAWDDWEDDPTPTRYQWNGTGTWRRLDGDDDLEVTGRLIGGCIETLCHLAGTRHADTSALRRSHGDDALIVFVEAAEDGAFDICRALHGMRLNGFFDGAAAVLVGRTSAPDAPTLTQDEAVLDALSGLGVPIIADVDCGHVPPHMTLINGALGRLVCGTSGFFLETRLV